MKAVNPGFWFFHCHIEIHQITGLALILQVGDVDQMPPTPKNFPTCGNFNFPQEEFEDMTKKSKTSSKAKGVTSAFLNRDLLGLAEAQPNGSGCVMIVKDDTKTAYVIVICALLTTVVAFGLCLSWQITEKKSLMQKYGDDFGVKFHRLGSDTDNLVASAGDKSIGQSATYMIFRKI
ncbi:uncharacterized protein LOC110462667 [Mizuhopecten yessoensis]|uniref:uncharacterized protein LOC110462667 n=1 Tax=Mizuhopecten yessoensis TaxID=6573 RepID=UPI000B45B2F1|nr:uncharacterized protein LOC110462667 [Mizuhopecten yessoensis]